jgi:epsin
MTIYDLKSMYNQAKNVVLNVSEMEAKVREATNDEPWGASSTLMQDIAQGTFNFQNFNEIMPSIYGRFMEKEARQWRQIYKALQLLEYLVKHGSERVVDDARSHISTLKMLRNFHYIDDKGKDEGQNVRNRARELVELLSDVDAIRTERRKAKTNRNKYVGTGNDPMSFTAGSTRYGGFGSDALGGSSGYYGDRMSGRDDFQSGGSSAGYKDSAGRRDFEEYNAGDDETAVRRSNSASRSNVPSRSATTAGSPLRTQASPAPLPPKAKEPEIDLLGGFWDNGPAAAASTTTSNNTNTNKALPSLAGFDDDDFADFQAAPPPSSPPAQATLMEMLNSSPRQASRAPASTSQVPRTTSPRSFSPSFNMFSTTNNRQSQTFTLTPAAPVQNNVWAASQPLSPAASTVSARAPTLTAPSRASTSGAPSPAPTKGLSGFEDLWSMSLGAPSSSSVGRSTTAGKSIKDLEKEKAQAGIWAPTQKPGLAMGIGSDFGNFAPAKAGGVSSSSNGGGDDLLL